MFEYLLNNYFPGLCEEHPPRPSHDRSSTRVREQEFWLWRGFFIWTYCLPWYNSRLQMLCVLFPRRLNNCRRVAYEEVRLPPATNQRCDLYVDDEVEVSLKLWEIKTCLVTDLTQAMWSNCEKVTLLWKALFSFRYGLYQWRWLLASLNTLWPRWDFCAFFSRIFLASFRR